MQLLHNSSSLFSGIGIGELGSVLSIQMFIEQLESKMFKVQLAVSITVSACSATIHSVCLNRTLGCRKGCLQSLFHPL